jgi:hypothetical protein
VVLGEGSSAWAGLVSSADESELSPICGFLPSKLAAEGVRRVGRRLWQAVLPDYELNAAEVGPAAGLPEPGRGAVGRIRVGGRGGQVSRSCRPVWDRPRHEPGTGSG